MKCLVTKLQGVVNNSNLLKIGDMPIYVRKSNDAKASQYKLTIKTLKDSKVEIIGDGYFTDEGMVTNKGKIISIPANTSTTLYFSNGDYEARVSNKYDIVMFNLTEDGSANNNFLSINLDDLRFSYNLTNLTLSNSKSYGDIKNLQGKDNIRTVYLSNTNVTGDAKAISINNLTTLYIKSDNISYDISNLAGTTKLSAVNFADTSLQTGNLSNLSGNNSLKYIGILGKGLSGDISVISNFRSIVQSTLKSNSDKITGDIGKLPDNITYFFSDNKVREYTYSKGSRTNILVVNNVKLSNVDTFLNDMADLSVPSNISYKVIILVGTRTSASDAAVQALQQKGYTVSIIPA